MLLVPLHKPLNRHTAPWMTLALLLVNVWVFFALQWPDGARMQAAQRYYAGSGLAAMEAPAYLRWLREHGRLAEAERVQALSENARKQALAQATQYDLPFQQALRSGQLFGSAAQAAAWRGERARYDQLIGEVFTQRHVLRQGEWSPHRMLASAFLHGGFGHLLGNMLFLLAIGLLLEGAIGAWPLLAIYVLGALGSNAASLLWRAGEVGAGLGASGAIAAMMGAFCVVWGRQPVRLFYWFGVVFNYVRAPAIWLLPVWLGWEIFSLLRSPGAGVAFEAHAGGLACGALMGAAAVRLGLRRQAFIDEAPVADAEDDRWSRAQLHLGRMENTQAEHLLSQLAAEAPQRFDVALARYRVARNAGQHAAAGQRAAELLRLSAADADQARLQAQVLQEQRPALAPVTRMALVERWSALGQLKAVEQLLQDTGDLPRDDQASLWFRLALRHGQAQATAEQQRVLRAVIARFPDLPQAQKARFLLDNA
ncbi:rhomboid family intramembrane serine protease [Pseudoxanthomonas winnipegensis]|uniref:Rhomboid family intramembrane serine protease n=1 Tax=Pseudoxanthomonas winnipegensis TaxID=2480810 RepID=A0A4Q8M0A6_9GAMM|nr:rhomboid family intramembrane serine protease [Pseudoxanthomonas winnipegensis]RZZ90903.1 rhomboid family intramembrane serine protease [Pseudoxanthomonas winnipegensis]TAA38206.1 rhomboid family intramembrane serine protease [Pseudoxanthomonas winnipegensis]